MLYFTILKYLRVGKQKCEQMFIIYIISLTFFKFKCHLLILSARGTDNTLL